MIKKIIKYYILLIFLIITFMPNLSKHNEYLNVFYSSPQYDISMIFLLLSGFILQLIRWKYDSSYRDWLKQKAETIIFLLFVVTTLISLYFFFQAINDHYFLQGLNIE